MKKTAPLSRSIFQGLGSAMDVIPDSRGRLERIRPYASDLAALHRDRQRIAQDAQDAQDAQNALNRPLTLDPARTWAH